MTRAILEACRHRIANDDMALGREPSPVLSEIDAELAGPTAEGAHTEGPWKVDPEYLSEVQAQDGLTVASCWYEGLSGKAIRLSDTIDCSLQESAANARLIAAAPAMLAALEPFVAVADDYLDSLDGDHELYQVGQYSITLGHCRAARAAYRKAKGGGA